jgi:hypothetical protein
VKAKIIVMLMDKVKMMVKAMMGLILKCLDHKVANGEGKFNGLLYI